LVKDTYSKEIKNYIYDGFDAIADLIMDLIPNDTNDLNHEDTNDKNNCVSIGRIVNAYTIFCYAFTMIPIDLMVKMGGKIGRPRCMVHHAFMIWKTAIYGNTYVPTPNVDYGKCIAGCEGLRGFKRWISDIVCILYILYIYYIYYIYIISNVLIVYSMLSCFILNKK